MEKKGLEKENRWEDVGQSEKEWKRSSQGVSEIFPDATAWDGAMQWPWLIDVTAAQ